MPRSIADAQIHEGATAHQERGLVRNKSRAGDRFGRCVPGGTRARDIALVVDSDIGRRSPSRAVGEAIVEVNGASVVGHAADAHIGDRLRSLNEVCCPES